MPTYVFKNTLTGAISEKYLAMSELDEYKEQNCHLQQMPTILNAVAGVGDIRMDNGFKDLMNKIGTVPGSTMRKY
jgi:hypothetical protein